MRYIKHFRITESSNQQYIDEVKDLADSSLVYLLDEGFKLEYFNPNMLYEVTIKLSKPDDNFGFTWNDIKDYYIPFLQRLVNNYVDISAQVYFKSDNLRHLNIYKTRNCRIAIKTFLDDYSHVNQHWWLKFSDTELDSIIIKVS